MFDPNSPDGSEWEPQRELLIPDLPPPVPPRKKFTGQVTLQNHVGGDDVLKSCLADKPFVRDVSGDLISFEDDTAVEDETPISFKILGNSSRLDKTYHDQPKDVARSEQKQVEYTMRREPFKANLDMYFKDDLFKSTCNDDDLERGNIQHAPGLFILSSREGTLESVRDSSDMNPFSSISEPGNWSLNDPFQIEKFLSELQFPDDQHPHSLDAHINAQSATDIKLKPECNINNTVSKEIKYGPHFEPQKGDDMHFSAAHMKDITSSQQHPKTFARGVLHGEDGVIEASTDPEEAEQFGSLKYDECFFSEGDASLPQSSKWHKRAASNSDINFQQESSESEEDDYILMGPAKITDLESAAVANRLTASTCDRRLTSQRSLSDSAICERNDVDDDKTRTCRKHESRERKQRKTSSSKEHVKYNVKHMLSKFARRIVTTFQQTAKEQENWKMKLVCACRGSCERISSLALSSEGHMWVSFFQCSWVSLYDHKQILLRKFNTGGIVDCLAVSPTDVLYISCPIKKQIMMLSKSPEPSIMYQAKNMHPRGLDVSPIDGAVVACMTSQMVGQVLKRPSKNSLMKFSGKKANEEGKVLNMGDFLGYPLRLAINVNGYILVSDFGLECIFAVSQEGHMLRKFPTVGDGRFCQVHCLTSGQDGSFYVLHGGRGKLCSTRLVDNQGTVIEKETSRRVDTDIHCKVRASVVKQNGMLAVSSGPMIKYISLD